MRRSIGPAYEKSPAELVGRWLTTNILRVFSAVAAVAVFCLIVNWLVNGLFNFLAADGKDDVVKTFSSDAPAVSLVKIFGSLIIVFFICRSSVK
jgi:hypothetical protein